jgi:hypothetical protein
MYSKYVERHPIAEAVELHQGAWGRQRTDSTHVLGRSACPEQMGAGRADDVRAALNAVAAADPEWLAESAPIQSGSSVTLGVWRTRGYQRATRPGNNTSRRAGQSQRRLRHRRQAAGFISVGGVV